MKKRVVTICLVVALLATCFAGTYAYLIDTDEAVNVMTLGNVEIEQLEYERVQDADGKFVMGVAGTDFTADYGITQSYKLQPFTQDKPAFPVVGTEAWDDFQQLWNQVKSESGNAAPGSNDVFSMRNVIDKFVFVENTGESDLYFRTIIAIELPEGVSAKMIHVNVNDNTRYDYDPFTAGRQGQDKVYNEFVTINGTRYVLYVATHTEVLKPGNVSRPSLLQVHLDHLASNADVKAFGGKWEVLTLSQAVQARGFDDACTALDTAFGKVTADRVAQWFGDNTKPIYVETAAELQAAIDAAKDGDVIKFGADIAGDVTVTQKADVKFAIDGNGKTMEGSIIVDGKSARYADAGLTIRNVNFTSGSKTPEAFVSLGTGSDATRYTNNVTVSNCTFSYTGTDEKKVAVKSYTGGDWNLTVSGCTVNAGMHSLLQVANVEKGLTITDCKVSSKNGANLNNTPYLNMSNCKFDVQGYAVRCGVSGTTNNGTFTVANSTLKSAVAEADDAVIVLRGNMIGATLDLSGTTLEGTVEILGSAKVLG